MTKKPKPANWAAYTKSELVQACNTLSSQKAKLLSKIAKLEAQLAPAPRRDAEQRSFTVEQFRQVNHGEMPNPFSAVEEALLAGALGVVHVTQELPRNKMPWET
jgi:hypothetical protein